MSCLIVLTRVRRVKTGIVFGLCLVAILVLSSVSKKSHESVERSKSDMSTDKSYAEAFLIIDKYLARYKIIEGQILDIAKSLERAKTHVRGTKTSDELRRAISVMNNVLNSLGINSTQMKREVFQPKSVCPEVYMGQHGKEYSWFKVIDCSYGKPLWQLVTIVTYFKENNERTMKYKVERFLNSMYDFDMFKVVLATNFHYDVSETLSRRVTVVHKSLNTSDGIVWNKLVSAVKTPYVLIARNIVVLTQDAMLERLVREMESLQVAAVAGAVRYPDGHWKKGCYQSVYRNYSLKYIEGYDESLHECLFCDFAVGPFLSSLENLKVLKFADLNENEGLFEDWFLRLNTKSLETVVCPDSMFNIYDSEEASTWPRFMKHWRIHKVISPQGQTKVSECGDDKIKTDTKCLSPCVLQSNSDIVKLVMNTSETNSLFCKLYFGTLLGAVKLEKVLPWELDADTSCPTSNLPAIVFALNATSNYSHLRFKEFSQPETCHDNRETGGEYFVFYKQWKLDVFGLPLNCEMSDEITPISEKPTKVLFDGQWITAPYNPGLNLRNWYGREIYRHAQHHHVTCSSRSSPYIPGSFKPCDTPNDHDCLDRYNADGDMSFKEILP